jgi:hypothetical protein
MVNADCTVPATAVSDRYAIPDTLRPMMAIPTTSSRPLAALLYGLLALGALAIAAFVGFEIGGEASGLGRWLAVSAGAFIALFAVIPLRAAVAFARRSPPAVRHIVATRVGCLWPLILILILALLGFVRSLLAGEPIYQILGVVAVLLAFIGVHQAASTVARRTG